MGRRLKRIEMERVGMSWYEFMCANKLQIGDKIKIMNELYEVGERGIQLACGGLSHFRTLYLLEGSLTWEKVQDA